jgi:hypothetical protein
MDKTIEKPLWTLWIFFATIILLFSSCGPDEDLPVMQQPPNVEINTTRQPVQPMTPQDNNLTLNESDSSESENGDVHPSEANPYTGLWQLTHSLDTQNPPIYMLILDDMTGYVERGNGLNSTSLFMVTKYEINDDGEWSILTGMTRQILGTIISDTDDSLAFSHDSAELEFVRVDFENAYKAEQLYGIWILYEAVNPITHTTPFYVALYEDGSSVILRESPLLSPLDASSFPRSGNRVSSNNGDWVFAMNRLIINSHMSRNWLEITNFSDSTLTIFDNHENTLIFHQAYSFAPEFVGEWELEDVGTNRQLGNITIPTGIKFNNDGTGIWRDGVTSNRITWQTHPLLENMIIVSSEHNIYGFHVNEITDSTLNLNVDAGLGNRRDVLYMRAD